MDELATIFDELRADNERHRHANLMIVAELEHIGSMIRKMEQFETERERVESPPIVDIEAIFGIIGELAIESRKLGKSDSHIMSELKHISSQLKKIVDEVHDYRENMRGRLNDIHLMFSQAEEHMDELRNHLDDHERRLRAIETARSEE